MELWWPCRRVRPKCPLHSHSHTALAPPQPQTQILQTRGYHLGTSLENRATWLPGIFVERDHLANTIGRKDPLRIKVTKKTPWAVAAGAPGDTWHLPPHPLAAGGSKRKKMASSASLLHPSTLAPASSPLLLRRVPAPAQLGLHSSPRRPRGVPLTVSAATSPYVEKEPSPSSPPPPDESSDLSVSRGRCRPWRC